MPSATSHRDSAERAGRAPAEVVVRDWALRDRPFGSWLALSLAAGVSWLAAWATGEIASSVIVGLLLLLTLWRSVLPVRYELNASGIGQSVLGWRRQTAWTAFRHCDLRSDGVMLLATEAQAALPLGGFYLHWNDQARSGDGPHHYYVLGRTRTMRSSSIKVGS